MDSGRVVLGLVVCAAALVGCGESVPTSSSPSTSTENSGEAARTEDLTNTTEPSEPDAPAETNMPEASTPGVPEPTCEYVGTDRDFGYMHVELTFTNPLGDAPGIEATYALLDGEGVRIFTGTAGGLDLQDIHFPSAGEQFRFSVDTREEPPPGLDAANTGCSVLGIEDRYDIGGYQRASDTDTCEILGVEDRNGPEVTVSITSPYAETTDVQVWWALRGPGDVRFDTATEVVDLVGAGETIKFTESSLTGPPPEWAADDVTCDVVGFWDRGG